MKKLMSFIHGVCATLLIWFIVDSINQKDQKPQTLVLGTDSPGWELSETYHPDTMIIDTFMIDSNKIHRIKVYINTPLKIVKP